MIRDKTGGNLFYYIKTNLADGCILAITFFFNAHAA